MEKKSHKSFARVHMNRYSVDLYTFTGETRMRSLFTKVLVCVIALTAIFGFAAPIASAQDYPPVPDRLTVPPSNPTGEQTLLLIQANSAAADAAAAAAAGDAAGAQAAADSAAALLAQAKKAGFPEDLLARMEATAAAAARSAAAANAATAGAASAPAAGSVKLAFTGASTSLPLALGATLVGAGGLVLLAARKREALI